MEKKLAIAGHATRGKEVIEIFLMLGGKNIHNLKGINDEYYYIDNDGFIDSELDYIENWEEKFALFTLEEFLEKFPYIVGDKVKVPYEDGRITGNELYEYKILKIKWNYLESTIKYGLPTGDEQRIEYYSTDNLNIWNKKETMEEIIKIDIPKGYEFAGVDDNARQVVFTKIQPEYPKTYEECCKLLDICPNGSIVYAGNWVYGGDYLEKHLEKIKNFQKLLICRDAYWKIAGEQMGLGKPWEPDWDDKNEFKYGLYHFRNGIMRDGSCINPTLLAFPTEEMRDVFLDSEEIAQLIENCKEFL